MSSDRAPGLSVVLPQYRTRATVGELVARLVAAFRDGPALELVLVDDADPERSSEAVLDQPPVAASVVVVHHEMHRGQLAAVISGLAVARGELVAVMDADLQDAPEDLPRLVARLRSSGGACDAVAAGRRGRYEGFSRELTGRTYRRVIHWLTRGRVPPDAGLFLVTTREMRDRVLALGDPGVHLVAALGRVGARVESLPVRRNPRPAGTSSYGAWQRVKVASRAVLVVTPFYTVARRLEAARAPARATGR